MIFYLKNLVVIIINICTFLFKNIYLYLKMLVFCVFWFKSNLNVLDPLCYDNQQKSMRSSKQCWLLLAKSRVHPQATIHCIIGFVK